MVVNLSKTFGLPASLRSGREQHKMLVNLLRNNRVFFLPSQNRGFLVLERKKRTFENILFSTRVKRTRNRLIITRV